MRGTQCQNIRASLCAVESPTAHRAFLTLETNAAAEFLIEPKNLKLIDPFLKTELSVKEFADRCDLTANAAFKIVRKLETLGMIACSQEIVRRGKPIKRYKATAPAFFVPFTHIPAEHFIGEITRSNWDKMLKSLHHLFSEGRLIEEGYGAITSRFSNGDLMLTPANAKGELWDVTLEDSPAMVATWMRLQLSFSDAKALQRDLVKLFSSYQKNDGGGEYLMGVFLVETPPK
jgi:hypothetical protein